MKNIAVIGLGKVGSLVATLLSDQFNVIGIDKYIPDADYPFITHECKIEDTSTLMAVLTLQDAVVSCLPYNMNLPVAQIAHQLGIHYFDLTEDVSTTNAIREMAKTSKGVMAPQCGLAPGYIGIIGASLYNTFTKLRDVELRVGALPLYPNGLLGYSFTWSPAGVINEYINDAEVIHNGQRKFVSSLDGVEMINIGGQEFEAFSTSGGLGTMCETLEGKVDTLNYKTIRYRGHAKLMRFLLYELILKDDRQKIEHILTQAKPAVREDVVYVYAAVEGWKGEEIFREEFYAAYHPIIIHGKEWRAISWTTAASLVAVVEMVANKTLPQSGFIKQEEIALNNFYKTKTGKLFLDNATTFKNA